MLMSSISFSRYAKNLKIVYRSFRRISLTIYFCLGNYAQANLPNASITSTPRQTCVLLLQVKEMLLTKIFWKTSTLVEVAIFICFRLFLVHWLRTMMPALRYLKFCLSMQSRSWRLSNS